MKKLFLLICIAVLFVSCREQQGPLQQGPAAIQAIEDKSSRQSYTVQNFCQQFDFNLSAIYNDAFSNKSWH